METVITDAGQVTAAWLEEALVGAGVAAPGTVAGVEVVAEEATWSSLARLRPRYRAETPGEHPETLLLKMVGAAEFGDSEVRYLTRDYADLPDAPIPRCYQARWREQPRSYHLLMEDLSETHANTWEREVTPALAEGLADSLAALHAHRWGPERLAEIGAAHPGPAAFDRYLGHVRRGLEPLLAIGGADLEPGWPELLREIFERHPPLMLERAADPADICLVHGDVNPGNILAPRAGTGRVYLIDRQPFDWSLTAWLGVSDLAYLLCTFWPEETRRGFELPILRRYHAALAGRGVAGYSWERLWDDYRLCVVQSVYVAVEWCVLEEDRERMRWLWTQQLRRALAAFAELRCRDLWDG